MQTNNLYNALRLLRDFNAYREKQTFEPTQ